MKTDVEVEIDVDLDKPLVCEVTYVTMQGKRVSCEQVATHSGVGHDVYKGHTDGRLVLCEACMINISAFYRPCDLCHVPFLRDVRLL